MSSPSLGVTLTLRARHQNDEITRIPTSPAAEQGRQGAHVERLSHGYPANTIARLAEQGFSTKTHFARYRINGLHPELVGLRLKVGQADLDGMLAHEREINEASMRARAGRR